MAKKVLDPNMFPDRESDIASPKPSAPSVSMGPSKINAKRGGALDPAMFPDREERISPPAINPSSSGELSKRNYIPPSMDYVTQKSPLSMAERVKLKFTESPRERQSWLQNRYGAENVMSFGKDAFAVRRDNKWMAVDPKSTALVDLPKDVAELISIVPEAGGTLAGGILGGATGIPFGAALGAGVGQMAGKAVKQAAGVLSGVRPDIKPSQAIGELGAAGAGGFVSELGGAGIGKLVKAVGQAIREVPQLATGLSRKTLDHVQKKGISHVITPKTLKLDFMDKVSQKASSALTSVVESTKSEYSDAIQGIIKKNPTASVNIGKAITDFGKSLKKAGYLDKTGTPRGVHLDPADQNKFIKMLGNITTDISPGTTQGLDDFYRLKDDIWKYRNQINKFDPTLGSELGRLYHDLSEELLKSYKVLRPVSEKFEKVRIIEDRLAIVLDTTMKAEKVGVEATPKSALANIIKQGSTELKFLEELDKMSGPGLKFMKEALDGTATDELMHSKGVFEGVKNIIGKTILYVAENPIKRAPKVVPKVSKVVSPVINKSAQYIARPEAALGISQLLAPSQSKEREKNVEELLKSRR